MIRIYHNHKLQTRPKVNSVHANSAHIKLNPRQNGPCYKTTRSKFIRQLGPYILKYRRLTCSCMIQPVCLYMYVSRSQPICTRACMPRYVRACISLYVILYVSVNLFVCLYMLLVCPSIPVNACISVCLCMNMHVCLPLCM